MSSRWRNWSGSVLAEPARIEVPATEQEVAEAVRRAAGDGLVVRVAGTGHSFTPLVHTDGVLLMLDNFQSVPRFDVERGEATVLGGTKLHYLGRMLHNRGLAMENMGDIDMQSIGGATGTGTHGTGRTLRNISSQIASLRLATASGDLVDVDAASDPDLFRAARVSMGMLGVMVSVTLRVVPSFRMRERTWNATVEDCFAHLDELIAENRHFEFFWGPREDLCAMKTLNIIGEDEAVPGGEPPEPPDPASLTVHGTGARTGWSHEIIPSVRELKFNEMEYAIPYEAGPECFHAVRKRFQDKHPDILWPVEYRTLAADDAWLSPPSERETVTLSIHEDARRPFKEFFADIEAIFRDYEGRPHWGKIHYRTADELAGLYPRWQDFLAMRRRMDPEGRFLNSYLGGLFGAEAPA